MSWGGREEKIAKWGKRAQWGWGGKEATQTECGGEARKTKCLQYDMSSRVRSDPTIFGHFPLSGQELYSGHIKQFSPYICLPEEALW